MRILIVVDRRYIIMTAALQSYGMYSALYDSAMCHLNEVNILRASVFINKGVIKTTPCAAGSFGFSILNRGNHNHYHVKLC